jgi:hypothetical protein
MRRYYESEQGSQPVEYWLEVLKAATIRLANERVGQEITMEHWRENESRAIADAIAQGGVNA